MHEPDGDGEPAHHARRPMNAFLIFCKRHRSVVRDKYPNLENRSITKILGEWWANLDKEEKACYTGLAKQYKDAFFSANPDFKWYKLPAPPLRTLSSRPRDADKPADPGDPDPADPVDPADGERERTNNNSTAYDFNKRATDADSDAERGPPSVFTPGKLADEAHMGGLSSLLAARADAPAPNPYYSPHAYRCNAGEYGSRDSRDSPDRERSIRELQHALSETTRMFEEDFEEKERRRRSAADDRLAADERHSRDDEGYQRNGSDDEKNRSDRSCKGKRYQEFMAVGGLIVNKRQRRDCPERSSDEGYGASCSCDPGSSRDDSAAADDPDAPAPRDDGGDPPPRRDAHVDAEGAAKTFKAADFDLDAKIKALPSLSLEKFQQKKRENKRKKKTMNVKPKAVQIVNSVPRTSLDDRREAAESWRDAVIGSQKRKPRKISITRLEIDGLASSPGGRGGPRGSPEIKLATEAPGAATPALGVGGADLLALATLAEVASNTSKLEELAEAGYASEV